MVQKPASSDQTSLLIAEETEYGEIDGIDNGNSSPTLEPFRMRSESLKPDITRTRSNELTPDAQDVDAPVVGEGASGAVAIELSLQSYLTQIEAVFRGVRTPQGGSISVTGDGVADLDIVAAAGTITRDSGSFVTDGFKVGQRISLAGSGAGNDGGYVLSAVTALVLTIEGSFPGTDESNVAATVQVGSAFTDRTTISFDQASQEIRDSGNGFVDDGFEVGDWITVTDAANSENNGLFRVDSVAAGAMVLSHGATTLVDESAGASVDVVTESVVENGTTERSFAGEKRFNDLPVADRYVWYRGMVFNTFSVQVSPRNILEGEFGFVAKSERDADPAGSSFGAGDSAQSTTKVLNATSNVAAVFEDGTTIRLTGITFEFTNNGEPLEEVAERGAIEVNRGTFQVSGTFSVYHRDKSLFAKLLSTDGSDETSLAIKFSDAAGNVAVLDVPRALLSDAARNATGKNTPVQPTFSFEAVRDAGELKTARWVDVAA